MRDSTGRLATDGNAASMIGLSNPFCTRFVRPDQVPYHFVHSDRDSRTASLPQLVAALLQQQTGLIVGPHGSGKTTLLKSLEPWLQRSFADCVTVQCQAPIRSPRSLPSRPWALWLHRRHHAARVQTAMQQLPAGGLLILDGAEQLSRGQIRRLVRSAQRQSQYLLATSHAPLPGIAVLYQTRVDRELIWKLSDSLLRQSPPVVRQWVHRELQQRDLSTLSNVRDLWFELYDVVQHQLIATDRPE